jgi:hypothetical protein
MGKSWYIVFLIGLLLSGTSLCAQGDSTVAALEQVPEKYFNTIERKIDKYTNRVSTKTIKTLTKLSRWEGKIRATLEKAHPATAAKLFGNNQLTFSGLLQQIQKGEAIKLEYRRQYDKYRDDMTTGIKYLEKNKALLDSGLAKKIATTKEKLTRFNSGEDSTESLPPPLPTSAKANGSPK